LRDDNQIKLHFLNHSSWSQVGNGYAKGCAFYNDELVTSYRLAKMFDMRIGFAEFVSLLSQLNGFFDGIRTGERSVFLAVDHVRSLPLFHAVLDNRIFVSDDAYWVREQLHEERADERSIAEFLLTLSVSGSDTLSPSVKQVQAGEAVALTVTPEGVQKESDRYYEFYCVPPNEHAFEQLVLRADACLMAAFKRLASYAGGSTIVVPVGGGLDSRLVVIMLKRIGYERIVSFTYGRPGNRESMISSKVASRLRIPWHFIPYSNQDWHRWYQTNERIEYAKFANGLSSTPHLQDWPAVWELKRRGLIPDDSIFAPGHRAAPSDVTEPVEWLKMKTVSADELADRISEAYCTLQDWSRQSTSIHHELPLKIRNTMHPPSALSPEQAIGYFERWAWESTWVKFLVNSVRVYEYWGYRWWLPLWDKEFVQFWRALPLHFLLRRRFEKAYVPKLESNTTGRPPIPDTSSHNLGPPLVRILKRIRLWNVARKIRSRVEYRYHHFAWYGLIPESDYCRAFHGQENINTYLANQAAKRAFPNWRIPEAIDFLANSVDPESPDKRKDAF
jgi:asparagine synthase (glutamine-hydrolysing)